MTDTNAARPFLDQIDTLQHALSEEIDHARETIADLTERLHQLQERAQSLQVTRVTLLELAAEADRHDAPEPKEAPPAPALPDHPAYQQIMALFADSGTPLRARDLCEALDLPILPKNTEGIRSKLKRLTARGILTETEPGLFTQSRA
ncbi:hypothetical protein NLX86_26080 [Streptomyces sp. A3M-1-3]|uniref:hypothetical protein n=1 Tax=Streptomyces sp. A3M-1-3 TaxID=2962044 RepID=UPI0020B76C24|nr:hypothetical protein [Streptomyces sp. A3M-1-3]MCP3821438.1 hypothetical protein [Streptomyces sp. A3M-1-3]